MRFGTLVVATVMAAAGTSAEAVTIITQSFDSSFSRYNSHGAAQIGSLNLVNQVITSAVISYGAGATYSRDIFSFDPNDAGTLAYAGNAGFDIFGANLPVPVSVTVAFSGTSPCANGRCSAFGGVSGDYIVPQADLALFAGANPLFLTARGGFAGDVSARGGIFLRAPETSTYASGTITYSIADVTPVPEPATWTMMIVGFGAIGWVARRRRTVSVRFGQVEQ